MCTWEERVELRSVGLFLKFSSHRRTSSGNALWLVSSRVACVSEHGQNKICALRFLFVFSKQTARTRAHLLLSAAPAHWVSAVAPAGPFALPDRPRGLRTPFDSRSLRNTQAIPYAMTSEQHRYSLASCFVSSLVWSVTPAVPRQTRLQVKGLLVSPSVPMKRCSGSLTSRVSALPTRAWMTLLRPLPSGRSLTPPPLAVASGVVCPSTRRPNPIVDETCCAADMAASCTERRGRCWKMPALTLRKQLRRTPSCGPLSFSQQFCSVTFQRLSCLRIHLIHLRLKPCSGRCNCCF